MQTKPSAVVKQWELQRLKRAKGWDVWHYLMEVISIDLNRSNK
jgi:hypothetical protein